MTHLQLLATLQSFCKLCINVIYYDDLLHGRLKRLTALNLVVIGD
ncbi:unnamed protein product, partial [Rotaria socialis]